VQDLGGGAYLLSCDDGFGDGDFNDYTVRLDLSPIAV
jgi:hypothetical protein